MRVYDDWDAALRRGILENHLLVAVLCNSPPNRATVAKDLWQWRR